MSTNHVVPQAIQEAPSRSLAISWSDPRQTAQFGRNLDGLEYLEAIARGEVPPPPIAVLMNFRIESVKKGAAVFVGHPGEQHYNPIGSVHGGFLATLCDSALGCAIHSQLPRGLGYTTAELSVNYLRPISAETGPVRCEATAIHVGSKIATAEAKVYDAQGRLYAHAKTTCVILG